MIRPSGKRQNHWTGIKKSVQTFCHKLIHEESGQAFTEYILILAFSISVLIALSRAILEAVDGSILRFGSRLERALKTGRAPAGVWGN